MLQCCWNEVVSHITTGWIVEGYIFSPLGWGPPERGWHTPFQQRGIQIAHRHAFIRYFLPIYSGISLLHAINVYNSFQLVKIRGGGRSSPPLFRTVGASQIFIYLYKLILLLNRFNVGYITYSIVISARPYNCLLTTVHSVSGDCRSSFQGERSKVKVIPRPNAILRRGLIRVYMVWCRGLSFIQVTMKFRNWIHVQYSHNAECYIGHRLVLPYTDCPAVKEVTRRIP